MKSSTTDSINRLSFSRAARLLKAIPVLLAGLMAIPAAKAEYTATSGTATSADAEAVTGGTFLNINNVDDTRNGLTISAVTLGASVTNVRSPFAAVNWSLNDSSDGSRLVGGRHVEDNNQRLNPNSNPPGTDGTSYNPFSVTLSGLVPGSLYELKIVALGVRADTGGGQIPGLLDSTFPDFGINDYDFSYGASAGSQTTFANVAAGTLIYEERSTSATVIDSVDYFYWKGAYACNIGQWQADNSGTITLFLGEGALNTVLRGARTQLDGVVVAPLPVTVNSTEVWDGTSNPHAADGVTLTGSGDDGDPAVYTVPNGLQLTSTGKINFWSPASQNRNITLVIQGGNLRMDAGAILNIERYKIRDGRKEFILDLGGANSITGAGRIGPITDRDSCPRALTIQNVRNVALADIDLHTENVNTGAIADTRDLSITATGAVVVSGRIDNSDQDTGGDGGWGVTIKANTIDLNTIDTRGMRNDQLGRAPFSGAVMLQALSPVGNYDPGDNINNTSDNNLTVRGSIRTVGSDIRTTLGGVTLRSVALQLVYGVIQIPPGATQTLEVGVVQGGASANDLFRDVSNSGQAVNPVVQWDGTWTSPAGSGPVFTSTPVVPTNAAQGMAYGQTLAGSATDADSDPLTYGKFSGPAWLVIAPNGALSGTPAQSDACGNTWQIWVTDGTRFATSPLQIFVDAGPRWGSANLNYGNAGQNTPYGGSLATDILYCGPQALTYAKVSGPAWLQVAADGTLSGTPDPTNISANVFRVSVSDGIFPAFNATLNIFVNGSPKFPVSPVVRATAFVSQGDYAVRNQTLAGAATDPQDPSSATTLIWEKVSGPSWLTVAPDGTLAGTPGTADLGVNTWTISAVNDYPATTAVLRIIVVGSPGSAPVEVVTREYWDGVENPHAADGVTLTGTGTESDPATYTVPRGLLIYSSGQIYTSQPTGQDSESLNTALHIKFSIQGDLTMDQQNNAFVTAIHARTDPAGRKNLILDLNGTNSIVGQGRIVGLGNRVNNATFPGCFDRDTPRVLTISNANNVSLYDINVQVRDVSFTGRPLWISARGRVQITSGIDNSDRDTGGDGASDITVQAGQIDVFGVDTRASRTGRNSGNIRLYALTAPSYSTGGDNTANNTLTVRGGLRAGAAANSPNQGTVQLEGVVLTLQTDAVIQTTNTVTLNAGIIQGEATAGYLFANYSTATNTANHVVNWLLSSLPFLPNLLISTGPGPGQVTLTWTASGWSLQTSPNVAIPGGWTDTALTSPAIFNVTPGSQFFRLKSP
jgi:hypothetical protein